MSFSSVRRIVRSDRRSIEHDGRSAISSSIEFRMDLMVAGCSNEFILPEAVKVSDRDEIVEEARVTAGLAARSSWQRPGILVALSAANANVTENWSAPSVTTDAAPFGPASRTAMDVSSVELSGLGSRVEGRDASHRHSRGRRSKSSESKHGRNGSDDN
jgi:hypothetical protein